MFVNPPEPNPLFKNAESSDRKKEQDPRYEELFDEAVEEAASEAEGSLSDHQFHVLLAQGHIADLFAAYVKQERSRSPSKKKSRKRSRADPLNQRGYSPRTRLLYTRDSPIKEKRKIWIWKGKEPEAFSVESYEAFMEEVKRPHRYLSELLLYDLELLDMVFPDAISGPQVPPEHLVPVYLKWVSESVGWGAFALRDIDKGEMIGEYTGIVLPREAGGPYAMRYCHSEAFDLDATFFGNETRFINHGKHPNVDFVSAKSAEGLDHVVFVATQKIRKDEQLLTDYGPSYWQGKKPEDL